MLYLQDQANIRTFWTIFLAIYKMPNNYNIYYGKYIYVSKLVQPIFPRLP